MSSDDTWLPSSGVLSLGAWNLTSAVVISAASGFNQIATTGIISSTLASGGAYTYSNGSLVLPLTLPALTAGTMNIGAAATFAFDSANTIVSMTPTSASTYIFGGTHGGTLSLKNTSAFAITVQVPRGTTFTTAANVGGAITVVFANTVITVSGIIAGSQILYRRTDTQAVLKNATVAGTTDTYSYQWATDLPIEVVVRKATSASFYQPYRATTTLGVNDSSLTVAQVLDT